MLLAPLANPGAPPPSHASFASRSGWSSVVQGKTKRSGRQREPSKAHQSPCAFRGHYRIPGWNFERRATGIGTCIGTCTSFGTSPVISPFFLPFPPSSPVGLENCSCASSGLEKHSSILLLALTYRHWVASAFLLELLPPQDLPFAKPGAHPHRQAFVWRAGSRQKCHSICRYRVPFGCPSPFTQTRCASDGSSLFLPCSRSSRPWRSRNAMPIFSASGRRCIRI
jgi:hypothetical protein